jgi:colanic acid biosynthesis glycosyl transferase WcaI
VLRKKLWAHKASNLLRYLCEALYENIENMRKIIFVNRFYRPDHSATSQILTDLTLNLNIRDAEIHVIASRLLYSGNDDKLLANETLDGIYIHRAWTSSFGRASLLGRAMDYLSFYITSFFLMLSLTGEGDVLVAKTDPPLISVFAAVVARLKGATLINWLQDLFPEVGKELGVKLFNVDLFYRFIKYLRNWSLTVARVNVVLGNIMADKVNDEISQPERTLIIPNWVVGDEMQSVAKDDNFLRKNWGLQDKFVIGYSGNLGRAHDYKTIFEAAKSLVDYDDVVFLLIGGGAGYGLIEKEVAAHKLGNVMFKPYQPIESLAMSLSVPDVHLISLEPELEGLIVPSKFYGVISVGRPVSYIGDPAGEIATALSAAECGYASGIGDKQGLIDNINKFKNDLNHCERMSLNARKLYEEQYAAGRSILLWQNALGKAI